MPTTDRFIAPAHHFLPVGATSAIRNIGTYLHHANHIVATEAVVVHHDDVQVHLTGIQVVHAEVKKFVEHRRQSVLLCRRLPLLDVLALVIETDLHVRICRHRNVTSTFLSLSLVFLVNLTKDLIL